MRKGASAVRARVHTVGPTLGLNASETKLSVMLRKSHHPCVWAEAGGDRGCAGSEGGSDCAHTSETVHKCGGPMLPPGRWPITPESSK
jgi:hypothetical protein